MKTRTYSLYEYKIGDRFRNRKTRMKRLLTTLHLSAGSVQMIQPSSIPDSEMARLFVVVYLCHIQNRVVTAANRSSI